MRRAGFFCGAVLALVSVGFSPSFPAHAQRQILAAFNAQPQPPRATLPYRSDLTRIARAVWGLEAPVPVFAAQIHTESGWRPDAVSPVGALGLAQFMPATAR